MFSSKAHDSFHAAAFRKNNKSFEHLEYHRDEECELASGTQNLSGF
jgi:hypothetical protein